ncbi:MAG: phenylalanine--tRNA ligase subunit alpha [Bacteroidetes bacterium]|nr:MAG: phenylalanine--tRNA ligase subunit alpha [Bacteroidota bacterium]
MREELDLLLADIASRTFETADQVEAFRVEFLGRKGKIKDLMAEFRNVAPELKRELGPQINKVKGAVEERLAIEQAVFKKKKSAKASGIDASRPAGGQPHGTHHPLQVVRREIVGIFKNMGFEVVEGPEIEDDWHVFSGLNFPPEHPARDMQDTFFVERNPDLLLRTHTSSVQVREMEKRKPPMRIIMPGRVFRNEAVSSRAHCIFHQIEGLYIDENVSFADLKQTLLHFAKRFFGPETKIRLRPSYFPFTEPSAEVDVYWGLETEVDKRITKGTGWLEILGCGMVDPNVLEANGIDSKKYSGFAFGMGIERITMLKYQIGDLRLFFENDKRFLNQFSGER